MGVNLMVPVSASGNRVVPGAVSGNCVNFTSTTNINPNGGSLSKWSDVNFYCDTHNYERDVVGTSSADAINSITLNGPINGTHSFFFTYTDDTSQPDYSIFTNALASFVLK
jgi:hypothetical protein